MTITTLNVFNNPLGRWDDREPLIAEHLRALAPDAAAFQEVDRAGSRIAALVSRVNRLVGEQRYTMHAMPNPSAQSIKSLAAVTRLAVAGTDGIDLDAGDIAFRLELEAGGARFDLVTTHLLYRPTREGGEIRLRQAEQLLDWVGPSPRRPTIVVGDFNALPGGATVTFLKEHLRSAYESVHGTEPDTTHPTPFAYAIDPKLAFGVDALPAGRADTIDYIFVSEGITVLDASVAFDTPAVAEPDLYPSDHFGLVARLRIG